MMSTASESSARSGQVVHRKRGGAQYSPLRLGQMVFAALLLFFAAFSMINDHYLVGWVCLLGGGIVSFLNFEA